MASIISHVLEARVSSTILAVRDFSQDTPHDRAMNIVYVAFVIGKWAVLIALGIGLFIGITWLAARFWGVLVIGGGISALFGYIFAWQVAESWGGEVAALGVVGAVIAALTGMNSDP